MSSEIYYFIVDNYKSVAMSFSNDDKICFIYSEIMYIKPSAHIYIYIYIYLIYAVYMYYMWIRSGTGSTQTREDNWVAT